MEGAITENDGSGSRNLPESPDQRLAAVVQARLVGKTWAEIAAQLCCDPKTLWALRQKYDVDALVEQMTADALEATHRGYVELQRKAEQRLREMLDSSDPETLQFAIDRVYPKREPKAPDSARRGSGKVTGRDELVRRARTAAAKRGDR